jgi:predicted unusual protein kinase regulating ubiquinone biosynthesis (AarF/ABC1/UbiB family)
VQYAVTSLRAGQLPEEYHDVLWEQMHERIAERVYRTVLELNGLWIKLAQYVSVRNDIAPQPYVRRLGTFQDCVAGDDFADGPGRTRAFTRSFRVFHCKSSFYWVFWGLAHA